MPAISVIVPVYNVEKYLADCLDSLLSQSFKDIEIICINDGSTDKSLEILKLYKMRFPGILTVINQENRGLSVARNVGLAAARGEWLCFVDSDDMLVEGTLEKIYAPIRADCMLQIINYETAPLIFEDEPEDPDKVKYYVVKNRYDGVRPGVDFLVEMIENSDYVESACLLLINRQWLSDNGILFEPGALYEDSLFSIECFFRCQYMAHLPVRAYKYRVHADSIMTRQYTFEQEKWRIWQFSEVVRHIFQWCANDREVNALARYARGILSNIRTIYHALSDSERAKLWKLGAIHGLFADCMGLNMVEGINTDLKLEGLIRLIHNADRVLMFGAGNVACKMYELLKKTGMEKKIVGFAVSGSIEPYEVIDGIYARCIEDYDCGIFDLLILSAIAYHSEMYETAKSLGFKNIRAIDYQMEQVIDRRLLKDGE